MQSKIGCIKSHGFSYDRPGANHDIYYNPKTKTTLPVKHHREIDDTTAHKMLHQAGIE
ncbi:MULTISPECIES: type II toxin-antitoxin system HicA family toxin [Eubacteriales]|uniref:Type II toxin-antitoxin system HicA family toxin n=1 Tax=Caproicibacter fermentans TaxID=2576756 RepID=A0A7G8TFY0_9FIRM|nr:type II toxin-antitoxin system HicA family toxin [Caproicibacter fermentans]